MSALPILSRQLDQMFGRSRATKRQPGRYLAIRGAIRASIRKDQHTGLWAVEIEGREYSNSLLRDLKHQLAGMGFDILAEADQS